MSMRNIAVAGAALALALGCEREQDQGTTYEPDTVQEQPTGEPGAQATRTDEELDTRFDQEPDRQPGQQGQAQPGQMGQQQPGQVGQPQPGTEQQAPVVTERSGQNFQRTLSQLTREMRQNDLEVVAQIRYDRPTRRAALRQLEPRAEAGQAQQRAQPGQPPPGAEPGAMPGEPIGDVRLIVFRHTAQEAQAIEQQGAEAILDVPREVLVFEQGQDVIVAYRTPSPMEVPGTQATAELLSRVVRNVTQSEQRQRAEAELGDHERQARAPMGDESGEEG